MTDYPNHPDHPESSCVDCGHRSDCATHNAPAFAPGPCSCKTTTCTAYYTDGPHPSDACGLPANHWPAPHSWEATAPPLLDFNQAITRAWERGWSAGHQIGWEHHQDGSYGNDYWDDDVQVPAPPESLLQ